MRRPQALYSQAVVLDPGFALAHARLASTLGLLYHFRAPSEELKSSRSRRSARSFATASPTWGSSSRERLYYYRIERDFDRALPELEIARRLLPNDTEPESYIAIFIAGGASGVKHVLVLRGFILAIRYLNVRKNSTPPLVSCAIGLPRQTAARAVALAPKMYPLKGERAMVDLWQNGDLAPLQKFLAD